MLTRTESPLDELDAKTRPNLRVREAMEAAGFDYIRLAEAVGCNPKTVQRWYYEGRTPHTQRAKRVAETLGVSVRWLWPGINATDGDTSSTIEVVLKLSHQALIAVDGGDDPPVMWIRSGTIDVMITPAEAFDSGRLSRNDLERASDLVMASVAYRTAIHNELVKSGVIVGPPMRSHRRGN